MLEEITAGARVRTLELRPTDGMIVIGEQLEARREDITGTAISFIPGNHQNAWWVRHDAGKNGEQVICPYWSKELALLTMPPRDVGDQAP